MTRCYINDNLVEFQLENGPGCEKTCLQGFAKNTGAGQPVHPCSLISTFDVRFLERIISRPAMSDLSIF